MSGTRDKSKGIEDRIAVPREYWEAPKWIIDRISHSPDTLDTLVTRLYELSKDTRLIVPKMKISHDAINAPEIIEKLVFAEQFGYAIMIGYLTYVKNNKDFEKIHPRDKVENAYNKYLNELEGRIESLQ